MFKKNTFPLNPLFQRPGEIDRNILIKFSCMDIVDNFFS